MQLNRGRVSGRGEEARLQLGVQIEIESSIKSDEFGAAEFIFSSRSG